MQLDGAAAGGRRAPSHVAHAALTVEELKVALARRPYRVQLVQELLQLLGALREGVGIGVEGDEGAEGEAAVQHREQSRGKEEQRREGVDAEPCKAEDRLRQQRRAHDIDVGLDARRVLAEQRAARGMRGDGVWLRERLGGQCVRIVERLLLQ